MLMILEPLPPTPERVTLMYYESPAVMDDHDGWCLYVLPRTSHLPCFQHDDRATVDEWARRHGLTIDSVWKVYGTASNDPGLSVQIA